MGEFPSFGATEAKQTAEQKYFRGAPEYSCFYKGISFRLYRRHGNYFCAAATGLAFGGTKDWS